MAEEVCVCTHIDVGGADEGTEGMHVVVQNDDADHHPEAEHHSFFALELRAIIPEKNSMVLFTHQMLLAAEYSVLRIFNHCPTYRCHCTEKFSGVFYGEFLVLKINTVI